MTIDPRVIQPYGSRRRSMNNDIIKEFADLYDAYNKQNEWHNPEILFGLYYVYQCKPKTIPPLGPE
jgi:hypothetical protein